MLAGKSLSYPIIIIFLFVVIGSMLITYWMDVRVLREVCDKLDAEQVYHLSHMASNTIEEEINRLSWILLFLKDRHDLLDGVQAALGPDGNRRGLLNTAGEISRHLKMGSLIVADNQGRVLYRSDAPGEWGDKPDIWGLEEALWGHDILLTTRDSSVWTIRAAAPIINRGKQIGAILINVPVNQILVQSLTRFSQSMQFFFGGADGKITFSQGNSAELIHKESIIRSFLEKQPILQQVRDEQAYTLLYTPLSLVDETLCLIVLAHNEQSQAILVTQRHRLTKVIALIFLFCILIGFAFIFWLLKPLKVLEKDARKVVKEFTGQEPSRKGGNEVSNVVNSIHIMTDTFRRHIEQLNATKEEIGRYAEIQQVLLQEVNHRVKNNLAIIISMLHMEINRTNNQLITTSLNNLSRRIEALATLHSLLSARNWRPLPIGELCRQVILNAIYSSADSNNVQLNVSPSTVEISSNQSHHLTLVINELALNSLKYAFRDQKNITIDLNIEKRGSKVILTYCDSGPGYPPGHYEDNPPGTGLGFEIMRGIVTHSLNGHIDFKNDHGARAEMEFESDMEDATKGND